MKNFALYTASIELNSLVELTNIYKTSKTHARKQFTFTALPEPRQLGLDGAWATAASVVASSAAMLFFTKFRIRFLFKTSACDKII